MRPLQVAFAGLSYQRQVGGNSLSNGCSRYAGGNVNTPSGRSPLATTATYSGGILMRLYARPRMPIRAGTALAIVASALLAMAVAWPQSAPAQVPADQRGPAVQSDTEDTAPAGEAQLLSPEERAEADITDTTRGQETAHHYADEWADQGFHVAPEQLEVLRFDDGQTLTVTQGTPITREQRDGRVHFGIMTQDDTMATEMETELAAASGWVLDDGNCWSTDRSNGLNSQSCWQRHYLPSAYHNLSDDVYSLNVTTAGSSTQSDLELTQAAVGADPSNPGSQLGWLDMDPMGDYSSSCRNYSLSISTPVGGGGGSFNQCDRHRAVYTSSEPGEAGAYWSYQGWLGGYDGIREAGMMFVLRTNGTPNWTLTHDAYGR